jgi:hypothetical protein
MSRGSKGPTRPQAMLYGIVGEKLEQVTRLPDSTGYRR